MCQQHSKPVDCVRSSGKAIDRKEGKAKIPPCITLGINQSLSRACRPGSCWHVTRLHCRVNWVGQRLPAMLLKNLLYLNSSPEEAAVAGDNN